MSSFTITARDRGGNLTLTGGDISNDTFAFPKGTTTITITQGADVTLKSPLALPTSFSNQSVGVSPSSATLKNSEFTFTATNNLTTGATAVTAAFTITATIGGNLRTQWKDPTIIFNPPE